MAPLIGLTTRELSPPNSSSPIIGVGKRYIEAIKSAGGVPILIPLGSSQVEVNQVLDKLDGIVLTGGEDVDPKHYGEDPIKQLGQVSAFRDQTELVISKEAFANDIPLLGICRGLQVANVALGGSLYQDIATQVSGALEHPVDKWEELSHPIELAPDSKLAALLGTTSLAVNSLHHQAAKVVAADLSVSARSSDGVIEALEAPSRSFFVCVQCHPEALWNTVDLRWTNVFREFIAACSRKSP